MKKRVTVLTVIFFLAVLLPALGEGTLYALDCYQKRAKSGDRNTFTVKYNANGEHVATDGPLPLPGGGVIDHVNWWNGGEEAGFTMQDEKGTVLTFRKVEEAQGKALSPGRWSARPNLPQGAKEAHITVWIRSR